MKVLRNLFLVALLFACFLPAPAAAYLECGSTAPDFQAAGLDGNDVHLSDFKGKVIVVKLGTTWCPDCIRQTGDLLAAGEFLKENDVVVVDVFIQENQRSVSNYLKNKQFAMRFVPLLDDGQAHQAYQVYLIPRLVIIDRDFRIAHDGLRLGADKLRNLIAPLAMSPEQSRAQETSGHD
jgi:thiol-disulfide isomerase/thioredoxin